MDKVTSNCAERSGSSEAAVPGVLVATMSVPALLSSCGSRNVFTGVVSSARPRIVSPDRSMCAARAPRASIATLWPARARWAPMIEPMAPAPSTAKSNSGMARPCVTASERPGDILQEPVVARFRLRRIALEHLSVAANEEFLEIPADVARNAARSGSEKMVHGMALRTVHLEFRAEWKRDVVFAAAEGCDLRLAAGLLPCELVAGEAHHREALGSELALQLLEPPVLRSEPAVAGDVDGERYLAAQCA